MQRATAVIRRAAASGRGRLPFLLGLAALIFVPLGVIDALEKELGTIEADRLGDRELLVGVVGAAAGIASSLLGQVLYAGAVALAVVRTPPGEDPSLRGLMRETRWWTLIAVDVLYALGIFVSLLLLIVPAAFFFARYALAAVLAEIEELGVRESFRRSSRLTRGSRRMVFGLLLAATIVGELVTELVQGAASELAGSPFLADWASAAAAQVVYNPLIALLTLALTLELGGRPAREPARPSA